LTFFLRAQAAVLAAKAAQCITVPLYFANQGKLADAKHTSYAGAWLGKSKPPL